MRFFGLFKNFIFDGKNKSKNNNFYYNENIIDSKYDPSSSVNNFSKDYILDENKKCKEDIKDTKDEGINCRESTNLFCNDNICINCINNNNFLKSISTNPSSHYCRYCYNDKLDFCNEKDKRFLKQSYFKKDNYYFRDIKNNNNIFHEFNNDNKLLSDLSKEVMENNICNYNDLNKDNCFFGKELELKCVKKIDNLENNKFKNKRDKYKFFSEHNINNSYINNIMPITIAKEIKSEKIRVLILMFVGLIGIFSTSLFIILYFICARNKIINVFGFRKKYIPHPFLTITLLIVSLSMFFVGMFEVLRINNEVDNYLVNLIYGNNKIPYFLISNYKKMIVRSIIFNWISFSVYVLGIIILGILCGFQNHSGEKFMFCFWSLGVIGDLTSTIIVTIVILFTMFSLHIVNIILTKKSKSNIISYYGHEIVNPEEILALKKRTNRICLVFFVVFILILTLIVSIPWLLLRSKKNKKKFSLLELKSLFSK